MPRPPTLCSATSPLSPTTPQSPILRPMSSINLNLFDALIDQVDTAAVSAGGRANLAGWISKNTSDPRKAHQPWSFLQYEYQLGILADTHNHIAIQKSAQTGASELVIRIALGLTAKTGGTRVIYVVPSASFAQTFAVSRIDTVIEASERLKALVSSKVNNSSMKQFGSSFLYIGGAQQESQAISIPAQVLIRDEYSFGDPKVLGVYASRLQGNLPGEEIIYDFSTPLFPGSGISEVFDQGTQAHYLCYHDACGHWTVINCLEDLVIPGWGDPLDKLTKADLRSPRVDVEGTYIRCQQCHNPISQENMADPSRRAWVHKYPGRAIHSYQIDPMAVAARRTPASVVMGLNTYGNAAKWIQYGLGLPYEASDATITKLAIESAFTAQPVGPLEAGSVYGTVAGADIGKTSHLCNGKMIGKELHVFNMETVRQDGNNALGETFVGRFKQYRALRGVIDAGPDISSVLYAQERTLYGAVWGAYFTRGGKNSLELYGKNDKEGVFNVYRTRALDSFVSEFNAGMVKLPANSPFKVEISKHLAVPKRISDKDKTGEEQAIWISSSDEDHWFFALFYAWLAAQDLVNNSNLIVMPSSSLESGSLVSKIRMRG